MRGTAGQGRPISEADRMAAAKELMNRGLGRFGDTHDRRISGSQHDSDIIHSGLARYIRERTDHGLEPARFLLDVASGRDEAFSMHQRVVATRELARRGWDTNYDRITSEDIAAYYERQEAREPTGYDNRLQEWRESERAAREEREKQVEEGPQLEAGLFAYLSEAEIARYEAMSAEEQADFVEQQRQRRAARQAAAAHQTTPSPSSRLVIPAEAGIQSGDEGEIPVHPEPVEGLAEEHAQQDTPSPSTGEGRDGGESSTRPELAGVPVKGHTHQITPSPSTEEEPTPSEGRDFDDESENHIDTPSPSTGEGRDGGESSARPEHSRRDGGENHEDTNWSALFQDIRAPSPPHPTHSGHPVSSQTRIRSP